ncbi:MAG: site-2 protease family protein, partial [Saprospiraceae bacterium]
MDTLVIIAQFLLSLSILVVLHEFGHFAAARMFGTRVDKFYLFFDFMFPFPDKLNFALWKKKIGDTEYGIGWFPMGGYVAIAGMQDETQEAKGPDYVPAPNEYGSKKKWQKLIIMLGGVIVNFILGFFIYAMVLWVWGEDRLPMSQLQDGIYVDELAAELGLQDGDKILKIGDVDFEYMNPGTFRKQLGLDEINIIQVERNGQTVTINVKEESRQKLLSYDYRKAKLFGPQVPFIIGSTAPDFPAEKAGLKEDDRIVSLNGEATPFQHQFLKGIKCKNNETIKVGYMRPGVDSTLYTSMTLNEEGKMGTNFKPLSEFFEVEHIKYGLVEAFPAGFKKGTAFISAQFQAFGQMFKGKIKVQDSLGGFGTIGGLFSPTWDWHS